MAVPAPRDQALSLIAVANNHGDLAVKLSSLRQAKDILFFIDPSSAAELLSFFVELQSSPISLHRFLKSRAPATMRRDSVVQPRLSPDSALQAKLDEAVWPFWDSQGASLVSLGCARVWLLFSSAVILRFRFCLSPSITSLSFPPVSESKLNLTVTRYRNGYCLNLINKKAALLHTFFPVDIGYNMLYIKMGVSLSILSAEKLVRTLFMVAKSRRPSVIFMDVIDSIMSTRQASENEVSRRGSSAKKVLVREAESYSATRLIVGTWRNHHAIRSMTSDMEVDAALDLSHTQNIGRMIKAHFPHSQFIVVFSEEGMFNNANVLFWTKFVDGVSTVQRTVASKQNK